MKKLESEDDDDVICALKQIGKGLSLTMQASASMLSSQHATDKRLKRLDTKVHLEI